MGAKEKEEKSIRKDLQKRSFAIAIATTLLIAAVGIASAATPIRNCAELQDMKNDLSGDYYLANDIDCSCTETWNGGAGFEPIGSGYHTAFEGTFDGRGHKITNLYINRPAGNLGLFGYTGTSSDIKNVGLENVNINGSGWSVGALVGKHYGGSISNCYSTGIVSNSNYCGHAVGGLVGSNDGTISNSYSTCSVTGSWYVGGLVGSNRYGTVRNSYSTGSVSGSAYVGGLVGENYGDYQKSARVENSYSTGSVSGSHPDGVVGGLVGGSGGIVSNSYSTGSVSGAENIGGLVGYKYYGSCTHSYWNTETSGQSTSACGEGKTTAEMKQQATFVGWDFDNIWTIEEDVTHPFHQWQLRWGPPEPFVIFGYVNHSSGNPMNGSNVTITNRRTGEVFTAETNVSFNYYQVITSSGNVSAWDILHFNATNDNSTEFDHSVTGDEINEGGFRQDIVVDNPNGGPAIEVNKTVWNGSAWVKETTANLGDTLRFRIWIHNNGTCCNLTSITAVDILSDSLNYSDNATVNGVPQEPVQVAPNEYLWELPGPLAPCENITIEFNATVVRCPAVDTNTVNVTAWCNDTNTMVADEDSATVAVLSTPFLIHGWVNYSNGTAVLNPNVTITNLNTSEVFTATTSPASNYYQVSTTSCNISAGNVLHFNASNGGTAEFDHTVTQAEMNAGGFEQNITIQRGICGDVNNDGSVTTMDGMIVFKHYFHPEQYPLSSEWAADVNCDGSITTMDGMIIFKHYFHPEEYPLNCC